MVACLQLVVLVFGPGSTTADADALVEACQQLCQQHTRQQQQRPQVGPLGEHQASTLQTGPGCSSSTYLDTQDKKQQQQWRQQYSDTQRDFGPGGFPAAALTPRQAFFADTDTVPLAAAADRVSAELLCPYPPGVPVIFPGERFTPASIQVLQDTLAGGGVVTGSQDSTLETVLVVTGQA